MPICSILKKSAFFALVWVASVFAYQNVLLLNSYNQGFVKTNDITRAIQDVLRKSNMNIHIEDMDIREELIKSMLQKYIDVNMKFDVIITVDETAFNYVKNHENILWENIPIVACGISKQQAESVSDPAATESIEAQDSELTDVSLEQIDSVATKKSLWSGIYEFYDLPAQIDFIQRIQSNVKRIIFITDNTEASNDVSEQLNSAAFVQKNINLEEWRKPPLESLADSLSHLNPSQDAVVLVGVELNGSIKNPQKLWQDMTKYVDSNSTAPVYSFWDVGIQNGVIGGNIILASLTGKNIGLIAEAILVGNDTYNSGFRRSSNMPMVDDNAAASRKLKLYNNKLPPETIRLNKEESWIISTYQQYMYNMKNAIIAELVIILLLGFSFYSYFKYSNRKLLQEKDAVERASKAKSLFLANMSHEIRNPLNSMLGFSELLLHKSTNLTDEQREWCNNIEISSYHLRDTFNNILDFSKIEAGNLKIEDEWVDIFSLCDDLISVCSHYLIYKQIKFYVLPSIYMPKFIKTDPVRLKQVLVNLVSNALKFTTKGSVKLLINPETKEDESKVLFEIIDTGIGIPKEKIKKIFEPFEQIDSGHTRKYGGSGLGLTISQNILHAMNSNLEVQSDRNGSRFYFHLSTKAKENEFYKKFLNEKNQKVVIYNQEKIVLSFIKECVEAVEGTSEETTDMNTIFGLSNRDLLIAEADGLSDIQIKKISEMYPKVILIFHYKNDKMANIKLNNPKFECLIAPVRSNDAISVLQRLYAK
ncbi:MAG: sensor histidine kinase [Fibromonadaceae bacterium]|jgi:signal transduction histidine kinase|nr:sensor histidine kinase [Fibromonadaceae bacterium]